MKHSEEGNKSLRDALPNGRRGCRTASKTPWINVQKEFDEAMTFEKDEDGNATMVSNKAKKRLFQRQVKLQARDFAPMSEDAAVASSAVATLTTLHTLFIAR
jgi:hypothetical protein